jgi:putative PEP-CTERM system TPR-repeat lipoprotein
MPRRLSTSAIWVVLAAGLSLSACDALTSASTRLSRGQQALESGNLAAALADARTVVEKDAGNAQGWLLLAKVSLKYGDTDDALKDLERARSAGASAPELRATRDQALLRARRFEELVSQPAATPDEEVIRAKALEALGRRDEAEELLRKILAQDADHADARLLGVRLMLVKGQESAATESLDKLLADRPEFSEAQMLSGRMKLSAGDLPAALDAFQKAEAGAARQLTLPEYVAVLTALVETQLAAGKPDAAAAALDKMQKVAPQARMKDYLSARISLAQGDASTAVATLQRLLAKDPSQSQPQARLLLGAALMQQGSIEQARTELSALIADQPENIEARKLMARLLLSQGDPQAAQRILTELPEGVQSTPTADWMRSAILSMSGERAESLAVLEQAAKADSANVPLQLDLVRSYLAAGRREDAARVLQAVPAQRSGRTGKQLLVLTQVMGQTNEQMQRTLAALTSQNPDDSELRIIAGQYLVQLGDLPGASTQFQAALAKTPQLADAHLGLAGVAMRQGDFNAAQAQLKQVIQSEPGNERGYLALAAIAAKQNDAKAARGWLEQAIGAQPAAVAARLALAELSYKEKQGAAAEALLAQAITVARDKPATTQRAGDIQLRAAQFDKAAATFERAFEQRPSGELALRLYAARRALKQAAPESILRQWLQRQPADPLTRAALAEYLLQNDQTREAIAEYEQLTRQISSPALLNNLAWAYQKVGDARAESTAKRAYDGAPTNASIADTYGWILLEKGRAAEALPVLTKAAAAQPDNAEIQAHLKRARDLAGKNG